MQTKRASIYSIRTLKRSFLIIFSVIIFNFVISAQNVDTSFNPVPSNLSAFSGGFTIQPDGKILVYGNFQVVQNSARINIARLNADGSLDESFNCTTCNYSVSSALVQPDSKIIVAGSRSLDNSGSIPIIRRLNADGSLDASFISPFDEGLNNIFYPSIRVWAIQPDGKIYVVLYRQQFGVPSQNLYRLNTNGTFDTSFASLSFYYGSVRFGPDAIFTGLKLLPDGKLLISGKHNFGFLFRVNPDGTKDTSFQSPTLTNNFPTNQPYINNFDIRSDGKIIIYGLFNTVNGVSKSGFARLNANQSLDTSYNFPLTFESVGTTTYVNFRYQSDDKLVVSGTFSGGKRLVRFNTDDSLDTSFNLPATYRYVSDWNFDGNGKILAGLSLTDQYSVNLLRVNSDGSIDPAFNPLFGTASRILATAVQADGKIIISGYFTQVNNISRFRLARLNADGTSDPTFDPGTGFNNEVYQLVPQPDGKILAVGIFTSYNGTARNSFVRINADGSIDSNFNPSVSDVTAAAVQADGKILVGGTFTTVNGTPRTGLARLNADGSLDNSFNPVLGSPNAVFAMLIQTDGKIMIGGVFTSVNATARQNLARLNSDGTLDTTFDSGNISDVRILERQPDGKYLISRRDIIYRKNLDGSPDSSFTSILFDDSIRSILPQADGTTLVGGDFFRINGDTTKAYLVRLAPNGTLQNDFLLGGTNGKVWTLTKQENNKIIVGGEFTFIGGFPKLGTARLSSLAVGNVLFDFDGDGKSDISVFRASENRWYKILSGNSQVSQSVFGSMGDIVAPADFDGDGKTDLAIFRPSTGTWWYLSSVDNLQHSVQFGANGDIPRPSDFDGDGKADFVIFRPTENAWYRLSIGSGVIQASSFGANGDKPLIGDFDGDGKSDLTIYRPSTGTWWWKHSGNGINYAAQWGNSTDIPSPADYDGDGKTDYAVYRPSEGIWYIFNSSTGQATIVRFGLAEDKPVPADYDGDGKADIAVFRPSTGVWYLLKSTEGFAGLQFGISTDIPIANSFIP